MKRFLILALILSLLCSPLSGAEALVDDSSELPGTTRFEVSSSLSLANADAGLITEAVQQSRLLLKLKQTLAQLQYRYILLSTNVESAVENLESIDETVFHLQATLTQIDFHIEDTNDKILSVKSQIERKKMELTDLETEAQILELQLEDQKAVVSDLMLLLYVKRDVYFEEDGVNAVKVLASPDSISETLQDLTYLDLIEIEQQNHFDKMVDLSDALANKWQKIREKREELDTLDEQLAAELLRYETEKGHHEEILEEMLAEKSILEAMLVAADEREEDLVAEIRIYKKNVADMERELTETRSQLSLGEQELIAQIENDMLESWSPELISDEVEFDWPVPVGAGITAYFHDEGYINVFGVDHYAVDIRANQGSSVYSPADGVVYNVVYEEGSTRYAYVMIAHRMGLMTLVGHVSEVNVYSGQYVKQGDLIAKSGGMPSTTGSGYRTTGPHVHMELWKDGVRVDPLSAGYFPLDEIPAKYLPEEYIFELEAQLEDELRHIQEALGIE
jgi:murein DD-endopeptidase MepM/ murein hydrolase activator NlpD